MLSERELRGGLSDAAADIGEDLNRAEAAIHLAHRRRDRRHLRRIAVSAAATLIVATGAIIALDGDSPKPPPTVAAVDCAPGNTVAHTPVVTASENGSVVLINNSTGGTVQLYFGDQQAVVPPGETEGTFPVSLGRQVVQCLSANTSTRAAHIAVVAAR